MKREEIPIVGGFSRHLLIFFQSIFLLFVSGLADDPSGSKNGIKAESHPTSGSSTGLRRMMSSNLSLALGSETFLHTFVKCIIVEVQW
ncbi:hypothetical protein MRB53_022786 [Persea americana]|uniref:Uncharacterized protein n=1 Tax=Persea americana TaxID=3435 RepID=A0ACC2L8J5_PERAE|nr:hypothetical protein MRB53_022786 [Persea americana]